MQVLAGLRILYYSKSHLIHTYACSSILGSASMQLLGLDSACSAVQNAAVQYYCAFSTLKVHAQYVQGMCSLVLAPFFSTSGIFKPPV